MLYRKIRYGYEFRRIPLTEGKYALVDEEDYKKLSIYEWQCLKNRHSFYAERIITDKRLKIIYMHREIMQAPKGMVVDHINHNGLDNRKANLRIATFSENRRNSRKAKDTSSKYKGVSWHKNNKKWHAGININGRRKHLGSFDDEIQAAKAYDEVARKYHGEFSSLNFEEVS